MIRKWIRLLSMVMRLLLPTYSRVSIVYVVIYFIPLGYDLFILLLFFFRLLCDVVSCVCVCSTTFFVLAIAFTFCSRYFRKFVSCLNIDHTSHRVMVCCIQFSFRYKSILAEKQANSNYGSSDTTAAIHVLRMYYVLAYTYANNNNNNNNNNRYCILSNQKSNALLLCIFYFIKCQRMIWSIDTWNLLKFQVLCVFFWCVWAPLFIDQVKLLPVLSHQWNCDEGTHFNEFKCYEFLFLFFFFKQKSCGKTKYTFNFIEEFSSHFIVLGF